MNGPRSVPHREIKKPIPSEWRRFMKNRTKFELGLTSEGLAERANNLAAENSEIRELVEKHNLTSEEEAAIFNVSGDTIARMLNEKHTGEHKWWNIRVVAEALDIDNKDIVLLGRSPRLRGEIKSISESERLQENGQGIHAAAHVAIAQCYGDAYAGQYIDAFSASTRASELFDSMRDYTRRAKVAICQMAFGRCINKPEWIRDAAFSMINTIDKANVPLLLKGEFLREIAVSQMNSEQISEGRSALKQSTKLVVGAYKENSSAQNARDLGLSMSETLRLYSLQLAPESVRVRIRQLGAARKAFVHYEDDERVADTLFDELLLHLSIGNNKDAIELVQSNSKYVERKGSAYSQAKLQIMAGNAYLGFEDYASLGRAYIDRGYVSMTANQWYIPTQYLIGKKTISLTFEPLENDKREIESIKRPADFGPVFALDDVKMISNACFNSLTPAERERVNSVDVRKAGSMIAKVLNAA